MKPHPRIRKTVKWGGITLCALIALLWVASAWWTVQWIGAGGDWCFVGSGRVNIGWSDRPISWAGSGRAAWKSLDALRWAPNWYFDPGVWFVDVPLWIFAAITLLPTAIAWRLDLLARRRARTNHCPHCHYSLAGLTQATPCPECGASR